MFAMPNFRPDSSDSIMRIKPPRTRNNSSSSMINQRKSPYIQKTVQFEQCQKRKFADDNDSNSGFKTVGIAPFPKPKFSTILKNGIEFRGSSKRSYSKNKIRDDLSVSNSSFESSVEE